LEDAVTKQDKKLALSGDIHSVASEIVKQMSKITDIPSNAEVELAEIVKKTLLERAGVFDDIRMGRIMGAAISMI
jgi:hypothetical protein